MCSGMASAVMPYVPFLAILATMVGWGVIIRNTKRISSRQETHALILQVMSATDALEKSGREFWLMQSFSNFAFQRRAFEGNALNSIESIRQLHLLLQSRMIVNIDEDYRSLRQSLTLDIEAAESMPIDDRLAKADQASQAARGVKEKSYRFFLEQYPAHSL